MAGAIVWTSGAVSRQDQSNSMGHLMKLFLVAATAAFLLCATAHAKWEAEVSEDAMTDEKIAFMAVEEMEDSDIGIALKCWDDKDKTLSLYIFTGVEYDQAAKYEPYETFSFRVDRGEVIKLPVEPSDLDGSLVYALSVPGNHRVAAGIKAIGAAQNRVAVEAKTRQMRFDVSGSGSAFDEFKKACRIDLAS